MLNPVEVDAFSREDQERVARQVKQFRAQPKSKDAAREPDVLLKTRLAVASAIALFFGG